MYKINGSGLEAKRLKEKGGWHESKRDVIETENNFENVDKVFRK